MRKATTTTRTTARAPRRRGGQNIGRRIKVGLISHYGKRYGGLEGVLVEKTSDPAWAYHVRLDNGDELSLDDWQFEFIGSETVPVLPVRSNPKTDLVKVETKTMAKVASKTRTPVKGKTSTKRVATTTRREREPVETKKAARSTAREGGKKPAKWNDVILQALDGARKMTLKDIYAKVEKLVGNSRPNNTVLKATVRRTLQALEKAGKTKAVEAGVWGVAGKAAKA